MRATGKSPKEKQYTLQLLASLAMPLNVQLPSADTITNAQYDAIPKEVCSRLLSRVHTEAHLKLHVEEYLRLFAALLVSFHAGCDVGQDLINSPIGDMVQAACEGFRDACPDSAVQASAFRELVQSISLNKVRISYTERHNQRNRSPDRSNR